MTPRDAAFQQMVDCLKAINQQNPCLTVTDIACLLARTAGYCVALTLEEDRMRLSVDVLAALNKGRDDMLATIHPPRADYDKASHLSFDPGDSRPNGTLQDPHAEVSDD